MVRAVAVVLFLVCTLLGSPPPAAAAPPGNDAFAQATPLQGDQPITVEGSTAEATKEPGEPAHAGNAGGASVWFAWTPAISAEVDIATCGSGFDTLLAVYTGATLDTLVLAVANDDACDLASRVGLDVVAGTTYAIAVDGFGGATGPFTLTIENAPERPANDDFADAQTLTGALPIAVTANTDTATSEPGEPLHGEFNSTAQRSVWYRWTANLTGPLVVDTCDIVGPEGTTYQSALAVYIGDALAGLTQLEADAGECQGFWARLTFDAVAGTTYSIAVDGYLGDSGTARLTLRTGAPPNDNIASAQVLPPDGGVTVAGSTAGATRQQFEPDPADGSFSTEGSPTIWYAWSPAVSGRVRIDTCGSAVNTTVTVWAGVTWATPPAPPSGFDVVASNSSYCGLQGGVNVEVTAGSEYRIVVAGAGFPLEEGPVVLSIAEPGAAPANDDLAGAAALPSRLPVVAYGTTVDATAEPGEALHGADVPPASVWYTWRAEQSGLVAVDTCRSSIAATFAVYTGDTAAVLTPVVQGRRTCLANGRAQFAAVAGTTYSIAVADRGGGQGAFRLQLRAAARPGNDDFAAASVLPARLPVSVGGSIVDATFEPGEPPDYTANGLGSSVWYRWTPAVTGEVVVDSCGSQLQTALGIWTGTSVSALTPAAGQQIFGCDGGVSVRFPAVAGTTYHLSADGVFGRFTVDGDDDEGRVRLAVAVAPPRRPPANDALTGAVDLGTVLPARANTKTTDATAEPTDPIMLGSAGERASTTSVWFRWTAPVTAPVVVDTCGSTYRTQINVGTQDAGGVLLPIRASSGRMSRSAATRRFATGSPRPRVRRTGSRLAATAAQRRSRRCDCWSGSTSRRPTTRSARRRTWGAGCSCGLTRTTPTPLGRPMSRRSGRRRPRSGMRGRRADPMTSSSTRAIRGSAPRLLCSN